MNSNKKKGTKFEVWLELVLKQKNLQNVLRNVEFHKERYLYRQVDVCYNYSENGRIHLVMFEAKWSFYPVKYELRSKVSKKGCPDLTNIVHETFERKEFVNADLCYLITNNVFEERVKQESENKGIKTIEFNKKYDSKISSINLKNHNTCKNIIYF